MADLQTQIDELVEVNQRLSGVVGFFQQRLADETLKLADVTTQLEQAKAKLASPAAEE